MISSILTSQLCLCCLEGFLTLLLIGSPAQSSLGPEPRQGPQDPALSPLGGLGPFLRGGALELERPSRVIPLCPVPAAGTPFQGGQQHRTAGKKQVREGLTAPGKLGGCSNKPTISLIRTHACLSHFLTFPSRIQCNCRH